MVRSKKAEEERPEAEEKLRRRSPVEVKRPIFQPPPQWIETLLERIYYNVLVHYAA
jgi:hypothetical protein